MLVPLLAYLQQRQGSCTGLSFVDATAIKVCHNKRIPRHKVFAGIAARGKTSMGWFYGFKLHLSVNDRGEILACQLTPGNVDDRKPLGYISQPLFDQLLAQGLELICRWKPACAKFGNISQIEHTSHLPPPAAISAAKKRRWGGWGQPVGRPNPIAKLGLTLKFHYHFVTGFNNWRG